MTFKEFLQKEELWMSKGQPIPANGYGTKPRLTPIDLFNKVYGRKGGAGGTSFGSPIPSAPVPGVGPKF